MITLFLYIDPGTGSMLFSILIGAIATLYFLLKAVVIKIKFSSGNFTASKSPNNFIFPPQILSLYIITNKCHVNKETIF